MIYRPPAPLRLWDTWLFQWEDTYHLFYLQSGEHIWSHIGHAVSRDLVHWEDRPSLPTKGEPGAWNEEPTLTGMVVRHADRFYMFAGTTHRFVEIVGVYLSDDLDTWTPHPDNPLLQPAAPYYQTAPVPQFPKVDWRDPSVTFRNEDGHFHALLCARQPGWSHAHSGAVVAHVRSRDLIEWEHLPPIDAPTGRFWNTEVPESFELNGKHYLMFSTSTRPGMHLNTAGRDNAVGTFYLVGDAFEGPYRVPEEHLLIGAGLGYMGAYVGRTIPHEGGRLLYHHIRGKRTSWGSPKVVEPQRDGTLRLRYLPALEKLETDVIVAEGEAPSCFEGRDIGEWQSAEGRMTGLAGAMVSSHVVAKEVADFHLTVRIDPTTARRAGVVLRSDGVDGVAVLLDFERGLVHLEKARIDMERLTPDTAVAGWGMVETLDLCRHNFQRDREVQLRCFVRDEFFEVYLDDQWAVTMAVQDPHKVGQIELLVECGEAHFFGLRLARIEPLRT